MRLRRFAQWCGVSARVVTAVAFGLSTWQAINWERSDGRLILSLTSGTLEVVWPPPAWKDDGSRYGPGWFIGNYVSGRLSVDWRFKYTAMRGAYQFLRIPLWAPFIGFVVPTVWLWRRGRRHMQPGHCRCGYDLTGNESGRCPECGLRIGAAAGPVGR